MFLMLKLIIKKIEKKRENGLIKILVRSSIDLVVFFFR